ncbi:hypothetical protein Tco_1146845 [Tanacetum coccineum]
MTFAPLQGGGSLKEELVLSLSCWGGFAEFVEEKEAIGSAQFFRYPKEIMVTFLNFPSEKQNSLSARYSNKETSPSEITSEIPMEVECFEPPQEEVISVRRSERTHRAPDPLFLNVEVEEHSLGDLNETHYIINRDD